MQLLELYSYLAVSIFRCYFLLKMKRNQQAKSQRSFENLKANVYKKKKSIKQVVLESKTTP